jgi:hypothetical protein
MSESKVTNTYDKMSEYVEAIFYVFKMIHKKALEKKDNRLKLITISVYNYVRFMAKLYNIDVKNFVEPETINMIPIFEYISNKNIELYDFSKIQVDDVDITKNDDLERFVLSHIYYITQPDS